MSVITDRMGTERNYRRERRRRERNPPYSRVSVATVNRRPEILLATTVVCRRQVGHPFYDPHVDTLGFLATVPRQPTLSSLLELSSRPRTFAFSYRPRLISNGCS